MGILPECDSAGRPSRDERRLVDCECVYLVAISVSEADDMFVACAWRYDDAPSYRAAIGELWADDLPTVWTVGLAHLTGRGNVPVHVRHRDEAGVVVHATLTPAIAAISNHFVRLLEQTERENPGLDSLPLWITLTPLESSRVYC